MPPSDRVALVAAACVLGCNAMAAAQPVTVRDAYDRAITLSSPPQRIVTVFASNTEMVAALGLADRIVGIETFTRYPPEVASKPLVGGRLGFSVDAVVGLRPDLVVVTPARQAAHQLLDPMQRLGVPIIVLLQRSVWEILDNIRLLGRAAGVPDRGEALAGGLGSRLSATMRRVKNRESPRTLLITGRLGNGLLLVARPGTYTGDAIALAGGRFALDGRGMIAQVSPEAILAADPDVLLYAGSPAERDELIGRPGWSEMRAVTTKRVYTVNRAELLNPGPRTIDGVEHLAALLHPTAAAQ